MTYTNDFKSTGADNLDDRSQPNVDNQGHTPVTDSSSTERYSSTDEMRAEFGSYRVNAETEKLSDAMKVDSVAGDVQTGDPAMEQIGRPEGN